MIDTSSQQIQLRDYQLECLEAIKNAAHRGVKRQLVVLATGTGKTVIFSQLPKMIRGGRQMLVIAHRTELLDQAAEKIQWANPGLNVEVEQANRRVSPHAQAIVASIQTLSVSPKRLASLAPDTIALVIVDEAHHCTASTYVSLLHRLGLAPDVAGISKDRSQAAFASFKPDRNAPFLVGFTATPHRTDSIGLEAVLDEIVYSKTITEMMRTGWLCKIVGKRIETNADISGIKVTRGDFQEGSLSDSVNTPERNSLAVKSYLALASGRQALVFCVDVEHTQSMCQTFTDTGVKAEYVIGSSPQDLRGDIVQDYKSGKIQVLVNCMVLTEGFDAPETSCIVMARPTKSSLLYTQMMGRGTRIASGKEALLVIDLVDIGAAGVQTVNTLFGLPIKLEIDQDDGVLAAKDLFDEEAGHLPLESLKDARTLEDVRRMARDFDPLQQAMMPAHLEPVCTLAWVKTSYGYALSTNDGHVGIVENLLGQCSLRVVSRSRGAEPGLQGGSRLLGFAQTVEDGIRQAEKWVRENMGGYAGLLDKNAKWRVSKDPATPSQLKWLTKKGIHHPPEITKGQASALLARAFAGGKKEERS